MSFKSNSYYTYLTQKIANGFASWMKIRTDSSSKGQQFLNAFGIQMQDIVRAFNAAQRGMFLVNADINVADTLYKVQLPRAIQLNPNSPPTCVGDGNTCIVEDTLDTFLYLEVPTRVTKVLTATTSTLLFTDLMTYDIPFTDQYGVDKTLYFQFNTGTSRLEKLHLVDEILDVPLHPPVGHEVLGSYQLLDTGGTPIAGTYHGAALYLDNLIMLFGTTLYVFDVRANIASPLTSGWVGNQELTTLQAVASFNIAASVTTPTALAYDPLGTIFWIKDGAQFNKFQLHYDYVMFDFQRKLAFFKEQYTVLTIGGTSYTQQIHEVWNYFDEFGLMLDTPRLLGESNQAYQTRLLTVFTFRSNSTVQGVVDAVSRDLSLNYYGYLPSGVQAYPSNLFPTGEFPSGFPVYPSGVYPSGTKDIAKINALYDPAFITPLVNPSGNIPSAELVDYTKEILSTFPVLWGSGMADPVGYIWDLSPFDGGLNNVKIIPDYFALLGSGIPSIWYESGVRDPLADDLKVRMFNDVPTDDWLVQIFNGDLFINNKFYHYYAEVGKQPIPSGVNPYTVSNSGSILTSFPITIVDLDGTTAPSGTQYLDVQAFDNASLYEFDYVIVSGQVLFNHPQNGLGMYYETSPSGWGTVPGWDFNPTHSALNDGFIWISDTEQIMDISGYRLDVNPQVLFIGGGASVVQGTLLDTIGEPIIGAVAHFRLIPSGLGTLAASEVFTGLDGKALTLYSSPTTVNTFGEPSISIAGNSIVVSGNLTTLLNDDIWTLRVQADVSGYPDPMRVMWMEKKATVPLTITPGDWTALSNSDPNFALFTGVFTIGGTSTDNFIGNINYGDDLFNIKLDTITEDDAGIWNQIPSVSVSGAVPRSYDIDNYSSPQDYGKVNIYTAIIPSGDLNIRFDTYAPVQPLAVQPGVPVAGKTTLTYDTPPDPSGQYIVYSPSQVTVESWATWQGTDTLHQFKDISMGFPLSKKGVFRLDDKFIDFVSYLRFT